MQLEMFTAARTRTPRRRKAAEVSLPKLHAAWANSQWTKADVARALGVTDKRLAVLADRHKLPPRPATLKNQYEACPDDFGEPEAEETLELSPWVQARIRELNLAGEWTQSRRFA